MRKVTLRVISIIVTICMILPMFPVEIVSAEQSEPFAINYDPNDGMIQYGHTGEVGMRPENDINNFYEKTDKVIYFPDDLINEKDETGNLRFPDYDKNNPYYDYTDMLNYALRKASTMDNADVFVKEGVYYFTKSVYLYGYSNINAVAGKTAFVIKPNFLDKDGNPIEVNGFFANADSTQKYAWYFARVSDIVFVVEGTHEAFKPTNTVENIINNLCSDDINAVENFSLFNHIRIKYGAIDNIAVSGFGEFMRTVFVDMLTRVTNITVGPTRLVYYGVETNDAFFYDSYYYGGYFTKDELHELPVFQLNFSMGTTVFSNSYIGNYFFSRANAGCWCPHTTYSNLTFERVLSFVMDTTVVSSSVSGCLFKDCAYNDIEEYFEGQGLKAYDHNTGYWDSTLKKWVYPDTGYIIRESIAYNDNLARKSSSNHWNGEKVPMIILHNGTTFTQNKIQCDSLDWTEMVLITNSEWGVKNSGRRFANNIYFSDNAFEIKEWDYSSLLVDDWKDGKPYCEGWKDNIKVVWGERGWNNDDGTPAMGWIGVDSDEPACWLCDGVYVSIDLKRYIDLSAFLDKDKPTAGYAALGAVGANEQALCDAGLEEQYYYDMQSGNYELVYFVDDFDGMNWNTGSNYEKLQQAFDYVATHDAILYIESGTYYTDKPIVLRGGKTYRVVFNGTIRAQKTANMSGAGVFVMSADDNAPISGYFVNADMYMQDCNTSGFFNVNTDDFYIKVGSIARGVGAFTNCKLNNTVIHEGQIQYCDYGFFYNTVTNNTLVKNVYGTASTWVEGEDGISPGDINYRYFISSSDFANSTWKGCWLEFGQFSNGKTLTGAGNSLYRGNIIDYTYNYSFGRNDVFCGNTLTRGNYGSIVNHMTGSNFPIDKPDILTDKPMVMFHISDGLRLIGNADLGSMSNSTHFVKFDSPGISYTDSEGNQVKSISNARVAGNIAYTEERGDYKVEIPITPFSKADNIVMENCRNNQILLQYFYFKNQVDNPDTEEIEIPFTITGDEVRAWSIPGVKTYVNGEYIVVEEENVQQKNLEQIITPQPPQDEIYSVPNKWEGQNATTKYVLYDFKEEDATTANELAKLMESYIDDSTITCYLRSKYNVAKIGGEEKKFTYSDIADLTKEQRYEVYRQTIECGLEKSPFGRDAFYMNGSREVVDVAGVTGREDNENRPTYAIVFRDENISGNNLVSVNSRFYSDLKLSYAWEGKRPIFIITSEDDNCYYGILLGYSGGNNGIFTASCSYEKDYFNTLIDGTTHHRFAESHFQNGLSYKNGDIYGLSHIDTFSNIKRPHNGEQAKTVFGDYSTVPMFEGDSYKYDSVVLGVDLTCEYNDDYGTVSMYATIDFSNIGEDTAYVPVMKATTRKVWLGTFEVKGTNKIFGIWNGSHTWIESVQFEHKITEPCECEHEYNNKVTRVGTCTKDAIVKHTCNKCGYEYEENKKAAGHVFSPGVPKRGTTFYTCKTCGFTYADEYKAANTPVENFVERMYTVALGREYDEAGRANWVGMLNAGTHDGAGIAEEFIMGKEFELRGLSDEQYVDVLYHTFFDREPDEGGKNLWLAVLASGNTRGYVLSNFVNLPEFTMLCASYGIERGIMLENGKAIKPGIIKFVKRLYSNVLGREADEQGLYNNSLALVVKAETAESVAKNFFGSAEYALKNTDNATYVTDLYKVFMDRDADESGLAFWVSCIEAGMTREDILTEFAKSEEFKIIAASYGLE